MAAIANLSTVDAVPTARQVASGTGLTGGGDLSADRTLTVTYGTASGTAAQGNDSRITGAAPLASPAFTGTPTGITKAHVGLGSVDNTADTAKPISTLTQAALDAKQPLDADLTAIAALAPADGTLMQRVAGAWAASTYATIKTGLALAKGDVGLGSVDNTADTAKPVSTAQQTALDGKRPFATPVNSAGNVTTWTIALTAADVPGELFRATGNTATTTLAVPTGTPTDGLSINLELLASTATSIVINASILLCGGNATPIALASGKRWFGGLRYVSGTGWFLLASSVQN